MNAVPKQPDFRQSRVEHSRGSRVGEVQERNGDRILDLIGHLVHGVGAQQHHVGTAGFQAASDLGEQLPRLVPLSSHLQPLDLGEIDRGQQAASRMQAAQPVPDHLVGQPVVLRAALPAHPADETDRPLSAPARRHPFTVAASDGASVATGTSTRDERHRYQIIWPRMTMASSSAEARLSNHQWLPVAVTT